MVAVFIEQMNDWLSTVILWLI